MQIAPFTADGVVIAADDVDRVDVLANKVGVAVGCFVHPEGPVSIVEFPNQGNTFPHLGEQFAASPVGIVDRPGSLAIPVVAGKAGSLFQEAIGGEGPDDLVGTLPDGQCRMIDDCLDSLA